MSTMGLIRAGRVLLPTLALGACTGQLTDAFRYEQQEVSFESATEINTKIDLLWVIDNSSSMDVSQAALREKLGGFARKYLKPYWDIRIGVITTDTYIANVIWDGYVERKLSGTSAGYKSYHLSNYISGRMQAGATPSNDPVLARMQAIGVSLDPNESLAGIFATGIRYRDLVPGWGRRADYARLLPGVHDGPVAGLCVERLPYFLADDVNTAPNVKGPQCKIRDVADDTGIEGCVNPASGQSSVSQCVNTAVNDTVRSGHAIIETKPPEGTPGDDAWVNELVRRFTVNISAGSAGGGSERGIGSVMEFLDKNEAEGSATKFFRPGSLKGIIFLTDEDDQTLKAPGVGYDLTNFTPDTHYGCDVESLVASNTKPGRDAAATRSWLTDPAQFAYCCDKDLNSDGINDCALKPAVCPVRQVEGLSYSVGVCPSESALLPTAEAKSTLDAFFTKLEGNASNYFVVAITPTKQATIEELQTARFESDARLGDLTFYRKFGGSYVSTTSERLRLRAVDKGWRYAELAEQVGNGSLVLDIGAQDYSELLDSIGLTLVEKKSRFPLTLETLGKKYQIVKVVHADGSETIVRDDQYEIDGRSIVITDVEFVLRLKSTDRISVNYQPNSEY